ncbi:MAG: hypothetical protein ACREFU_04775 [Acetobacteraceae bacterium]
MSSRTSPGSLPGIPAALLGLVVAMAAIPTFAQDIPNQLLQAAEAGDADAQYNVGGIYYQHQDYARSCEWFRQAAARGATAAQSMLQIMQGTGHPCAPLSASEAEAARKASRPDVGVMAAEALAYARRWHDDAVLTFVDVETDPNMITFTLVSQSARKVLQLNDGSPGGITSDLRGNTIDLPLPHGFIDLSKAIDVAHAHGMRGDLNRATLRVYRAPDGQPLAAWLITAQHDADFHAWLVGALDGKLYADSRYLEPIDGNDAQLRALAAMLAPKPPPAPSRGTYCTMSQRLNIYDPCGKTRPSSPTVGQIIAGQNWARHMAGDPTARY